MQDWRVSEEETHSDHNIMIFNILPSRTNTNLSRQIVDTTRKFATKVGKWNLFKREVNKSMKIGRPLSNIPMKRTNWKSPSQQFGRNWSILAKPVSLLIHQHHDMSHGGPKV